ncbi:MAG TPA: hypothetical protein VFB06_25060 [Streptosporangiaceae bacterium]|nr:hypothetical protein [Streptosporangiaceae bacterium]
MSTANIPAFLRYLAANQNQLEELETQAKDNVIRRAADLGFEFSEDEFDTLIWDSEQRLAEFRRDKFDATFPLWDLMWGKYYLEYLVTDLTPSCTESGLVGWEM